MNLCVFTGRVGREPESRQAGAEPVLSWPLAVDTGTRDRPATMWLDCNLWGKRGTSLAAYIAKGQKLTVSGRLAQEEFQAKDGSTKTKLRLTVDQVELPPKGEASAPAPAPAPSRKAPPRLQDMDDDLPF
jgi:single-strand DNA-binding protein